MRLQLQHRSTRAWTSSYPVLACRCTCPCGQGSNNATGRSPTVGLAIVRRKFVVLGRSHPGAGDCLLATWSVVLGVHLWVRVVGHCSQHRSHRLLLVSPPRAQTRCLLRRVQPCAKSPGSQDSRRLRHPGSPRALTVRERSKARKNGAQLRHSRRSAKNDAKCDTQRRHRKSS